MDVHFAGDVIALVPLVDTIHGCSGPQLQRHFAPGWPDSDDIPKAVHGRIGKGRFVRSQWWTDRKSTRLNSSHVAISYAVFCLKKKTIIGKDNREVENRN